MASWLFASPPDRRLLGETRFRGPTPWVIAIMSFSIMIIAATGLALSSTAGSLGEGIAARYALEVPNGGQNMAALVQALRSDPGVGAVEAVPEAEMRSTLARWLGPAARDADLPVPALINFDLKPGANLDALRTRVHGISPAAQFSTHRERLAPLIRSLREIQWLSFGLVLLLSGAATAAVVLAARGALDTHRFTIEVLHGIGATDEQVTQLFQRKIAIDALVGSLGGAVAGAVVLLLLSSGASFAGSLVGGATLGLVDLLILSALPFALTALATWVARRAVLTALHGIL